MQIFLEKLQIVYVKKKVSETENTFIFNIKGHIGMWPPRLMFEITCVVIMLTMRIQYRMFLAFDLELPFR